MTLNKDLTVLYSQLYLILLQLIRTVIWSPDIIVHQMFFHKPFNLHLTYTEVVVIIDNILTYTNILIRN